MKTEWMCFLIAGLCSLTATGQMIVSANENKLTLEGGMKVIDAPAPDSLTFADFSVFPPAVSHVTGIPNTVIGPPSNLALTPDGKQLLLASSVRINPAAEKGWTPDCLLMLVDMEQTPPAVIDRNKAGLQPSGLAVSPDGRLVLVTNRGDGTVSVFRLDGKLLIPHQTVKICTQDKEPVDVAISPDGRLALVAVNKGGYLQVLKIEDERVFITPLRLSVFGSPYRCAISADGRIAAACGWGSGGGRNPSAVTVVDLTDETPRTVYFAITGVGPESLCVSPDGNQIAVALINGSGSAPDSSDYRDHGEVDLIVREGAVWRSAGRFPVGRIPEGVVFTPDGRYLIVQCHSDRELRVLEVCQSRLLDTGLRIPVPGGPSAITAGKSLRKQEDLGLEYQ